MADEKRVHTPVELLMAEARADLLKDNKKKWINELKGKLITLERAKKVVRNCENDITDLELRINDELK